MMRMGMIGGSSLFHAPTFAHRFHPMPVQETPYGSVQLYHGIWRVEGEAKDDGGNEAVEIIFCQRHHADGQAPEVYRQPKLINYRAIVWALHHLECRLVLGVYSVGSMRPDIPVGRYDRRCPMD